MKPTLLVLAAGIGSRYGGLKQIDPVGPNGEIILDYSVFDAIRGGFSQVVFVIRRDIEADFREAIGRRLEGRIAVRYVHQEIDALPSGFSPPAGRTKPWGTGHAVLTAGPAVASPFVAINADDFYGATSFAVLGEYLTDAGNAGEAGDAGSSEHAMVGFTLRNTLSEVGSVSRGVCSCDAQDYLVEITERLHVEKVGEAARCADADGVTRPLTGDETVSMNMWGFQPSIFADFKERFIRFLEMGGDQPGSEFHLPTGVNDLIEARKVRVRVLSTPDAWCGVTHPDDKPRVAQHLRSLVDRGDYPSPLWT